MLDYAMQEPESAVTMSTGAFLEPSEVAESVIGAMREERFLILPHPEVARYQQLKAAAPDKWIEGMHQLMESARDLDSGAPPAAGA